MKDFFLRVCAKAKLEEPLKVSALLKRERMPKNIRYNFLRGYKSEKSRKRKRMRAKRNKEKLSQVDLMTKKTRKNCFASFKEILYRTVG